MCLLSDLTKYEFVIVSQYYLYLLSDLLITHFNYGYVLARSEIQPNQNRAGPDHILFASPDS